MVYYLDVFDLIVTKHDHEPFPYQESTLKLHLYYRQVCSGKAKSIPRYFIDMCST